VNKKGRYIHLDILNWKHFKGGIINEPFLALFNNDPVQDEEFRNLINNSSENVYKHNSSHYSLIRECLNPVQNHDRFISIDLTS